jgi:predicted 3-demethylubiquinone-9 3-methyltransferase (glyoxalase superfamily)
MQKITTFLSFNDQAEEAVKLYTSVFKGSRVTAQTYYGAGGPGQPGTLMTAAFELFGQQFVVLNGGPHFKFSEGISLVVNCETQDEVDYYWERLSEGGEKGPCGWLKDRFGVSWQIVPTGLGRLLGDREHPERSKRAMAAMMQMKKLDIRALTKAYEGE